LKGTGVPFTFRKCNTDQAVTDTPTAIIGIDTRSLAPSGRGRGRFRNLSIIIAADTNRAINAPKIITPIGVRRVRVFFVPVAAL
jgi:hypothetical protein